MEKYPGPLPAPHLAAASAPLAKIERERLQEENPGHPIAALDEEAFIACFEWLRRRRFWLYLGFFMVLASIETFLVMAILAGVHEIFYPGPWMWGFIAIFVLTAGWAVCLWATLYLYSVRRDASLLKNLKRWRGL